MTCFGVFTPTNKFPGVYPGDTIIIPGNGIRDDGGSGDETASGDTAGVCGTDAITLTINDPVTDRVYTAALTGGGILTQLSALVWCWVPPEDDNQRDGCFVDFEINGIPFYRYIPHLCCKYTTMPLITISGPSIVDVNSTNEYTLSDAKIECDYDWYSTAGWIVAGQFIAPSTPCTVTLSVKPFMGDDSAETCATKNISVIYLCNGKIAYTSLQMTVSQQQTLTVTGGAVGEVYSWAASSGSVSPNSGNSTIYTAPSSNPGCIKDNITLSCGGSVVDTITISIVSNTGSGTAYIICYFDYMGACNMGVGRGYYHTPAMGHKGKYDCTGTFTSNVGFNGGSYTEYGSCAASWTAEYMNVLSNLGCSSYGVITDVRTAGMKAAGCCPAALL